MLAKTPEVNDAKRVSAPELRSAWVTLLVGALGIIVTSTCYALSPTALALPIGAERLGEAAALASNARVLAFGGAVGVPADLLFAAAALVLARGAGTARTSLGWSLAALSALVFTFADGMAARCLSPGAGFALAKPLFDVLFVAGTFAFGVATLLVFWERRSALFGKALLAVGGLGTLGSLGVLAGVEAGFVLGVAIGLGVVLYAVEALRQLAALPSAQALPNAAAKSRAKSLMLRGS